MSGMTCDARSFPGERPDDTQDWRFSPLLMQKNILPNEAEKVSGLPAASGPIFIPFGSLPAIFAGSKEISTLRPCGMRDAAFLPACTKVAGSSAATTFVLEPVWR